MFESYLVFTKGKISWFTDVLSKEKHLHGLLLEEKENEIRELKRQYESLVKNGEPQNFASDRNQYQRQIEVNELNLIWLCTAKAVCMT